MWIRKKLLTREEYQEILESDEYVAVGAKAGEKLVGAVHPKERKHLVNPMLKKNHTLYIDAVYVMEDYRRRGVGKQLNACNGNTGKKRKAEKD